MHERSAPEELGKKITDEGDILLNQVGIDWQRQHTTYQRLGVGQINVFGKLTHDVWMLVTGFGIVNSEGDPCEGSLFKDVVTPARIHLDHEEMVAVTPEIAIFR
jgi:hypothetical protein